MEPAATTVHAVDELSERMGYFIADSAIPEV